MKHCILLFVICSLALTGCSKDYRAAVVGRWDAGPVDAKSHMIIDLRQDQSLSVSFTNREGEPVTGTYRVEGARLTISFPRSKSESVYQIDRVENGTMIIRSDIARITWNRIH